MDGIVQNVKNSREIEMKLSQAETRRKALLGGSIEQAIRYCQLAQESLLNALTYDSKDAYFNVKAVILELNAIRSKLSEQFSTELRVAKQADDVQGYDF